MLARNLDAYLALVADILVRPTFAAAELERTRHEVDRPDRRAPQRRPRAGGRFFVAQPLRRSSRTATRPTGSRRRSRRRGPTRSARTFAATSSGKNLVFAFAGDVDADALAAALKRAFKGLSARRPPPEPNALELREPVPPKGWRIQLVDKPDRQQTQLLFGHPAVRADRSGLPAAHARAGRVRRPRDERDDDERDPPQARPRLRRLPDAGASGAASAPRPAGCSRAATRPSTTLKLVLRLYVAFMEKGLSRGRRRVLQALPDRLARVGHGRARAPAGRARVRRGRRPARRTSSTPIPSASTR